MSTLMLSARVVALDSFWDLGARRRQALASAGLSVDCTP
jgi:hypothetical protein